MKRLIFAILAIAAAVALTGCKQFTAAPSKTYTAELLMPGNTLVYGECDEVIYCPENWMKVKINGTWYATNDWRVVLKEVQQ